ncbi:MAG: TetR/AcrR family transcriptional regulator [Pseudomonadota bacterium]
MPDPAPTRETYHHGNLPGALIAEGARLLAEKGLEGFSLRKVAERTGVSVAAPSHHFGNARGLLTAIATEGFARLSTRLEAATAGAPDARQGVIAICRAYVEMGADEPGHAAVMFRLDLLDAEDARFRARAFDAFDHLKTALDRAAPDGVAPARLSAAARAIWAAMHVIVALPMLMGPDTEEIIHAAVDAHLAGLDGSNPAGRPAASRPD